MLRQQSAKPRAVSSAFIDLIQSAWQVWGRHARNEEYRAKLPLRGADGGTSLCDERNRDSVADVGVSDAVAGRAEPASDASALAWAYAGDDERAQSLIDDLGQTSPEATAVQFNYLPTLRAKLAVRQGNSSEALETLRAAMPYELGRTTYSSYGWTALYPVYVRGEVYLAAHQGKEAAAEFQKILDHRGIVLNGPIGALARLHLGRAYALQGDTTKAKAAYRDFLTLWKDADPDVPILKEAKSEYAKLK
jgi:tetratricopeptide (TPR) repeat protein